MRRLWFSISALAILLGALALPTSSGAQDGCLWAPDSDYPGFARCLRESSTAVTPTPTEPPAEPPAPPAEPPAPTPTEPPAEPPAPTPTEPPAEPPAPTTGCDLIAAAFCDTFDSGTPGDARNGDLSDNYSVSRWRSQFYPNAGVIGRSQVDVCRPGVSSNPLPPGDVLVCNPSAEINSNHALISAAEQNYGDTLARINQRFDITNRTGIIQFDTNPTLGSALLGWPVLVFSEKPYSAPSHLTGNTAGATPEHGLAIHFNGKCFGGGQWSPLPTLLVHNNHTETQVASIDGCDQAVSVQDGHLNRVQVHLANDNIEIWMSDVSSDGVSFGPLHLMYSAPLSLNFEIGHLYLGTHNHASQKYGGDPSWETYWDNVAFDGPVLPQRVSQVPDNSLAQAGGVMTGYPLVEGEALTFTVDNVIANGTAHLTFNALIDRTKNDLSAARIFYTINGGEPHELRLSAAELALAGNRSPTFAFSTEISGLVNGTNTITFQGGPGIYAGIKPFVANIDIIT